MTRAAKGRKAGAFAGRMQRERAGRAWRHRAEAAGFVAIAAAIWWLWQGLPPWWVLLVPAVLAVWRWKLAEEAAKGARRAAVGAESERRVDRRLRRMVGLRHTVANAEVGARGDADHVALGPVAAVVETKTGRGPLAVDGRKLHVGGRTIPGDPVGQAQRQAAALARLAGLERVDAVVCIPDMTGRRRKVDGVWICSLAQLPRVLRRLPRRLDPGAATELAQRLR